MLKRQRGSLLIEGLVSILIFAIGVLALMGMQAVAIKNASQAQYRSDAALMANQILGVVMADQANIQLYADGGGSAVREAWDQEVATTLPNGSTTITYSDTSDNPRLLTITINWRAPDESSGETHQHVTTANVLPAENPGSY